MTVVVTIQSTQINAPELQGSVVNKQAELLNNPTIVSSNNGGGGSVRTIQLQCVNVGRTYTSGLCAGLSFCPRSTTTLTNPYGLVGGHNAPSYF